MAQQRPQQRLPMAQPVEHIRQDAPNQSPGLRRYYESPEDRKKFREKVEKGIGMGTDALDTVAAVMVNIGKVTRVPYLAESAGLVVALVDIVNNMKSNKAKFRYLAERTGKIVSIIFHEMHEKDRLMSDDLKLKLASMHSQLQQILEFAMKKPDEARWRRAIGRKPDADAIAEYERRLDQALNEFNFQNQINQTALIEWMAKKMAGTDDRTEDSHIRMVTNAMDGLSLDQETIEREKRELAEARERARREQEEADREAAERRAREDAEWQAKRQAEELVEHLRKEKEKRDREVAAKAEAERRRKEREDWEAERKAADERAEAERLKREQQEADERDRIRYAELTIKLKEERLKKAAAEQAAHGEMVRLGEKTWAQLVQKEEGKKAKQRAQEAREHEERIERLRQEEQRAIEADKRRKEAEEARQQKEEAERRRRARASQSSLRPPESNARPHRHSWNSSSQQDYSSPPPSDKNPFRRTPVQSPDPYLNDPHGDDGCDAPPPPRRPARRNQDYYPEEIPAFSPSPPLYGPEAGRQFLPAFSPSPPLYGPGVGRQFLNSGNSSSTYISGSFNDNSVVYGSSRRHY